MKIVAWIPIEMNKEKISENAFLPLGGKPLCYHAFETFLGMDKIDEVYAFWPESEDVQPLPEGVRTVLYENVLNKTENKIQDLCLQFSEAVDADVYICAHANAPFVKAESVERGLENVFKGCYDSAVPVKKMDNLVWEYDLQNDRMVSGVAEAQKTGQRFYETGGFCIYTKELIQMQGKHIGSKPFLTEIGVTEAVVINSQEDYEVAQAILAKKYGRENDRYNIHILQQMLTAMRIGKDISEYFDLYAYRTCAIYGVGLLGKQLYSMLNKDIVSVKVFIDQSGKGYDGVECIKPDDVTAMADVDIIIITPGFDEKNIRCRLEGVSCPIICIEELLKFNRDMIQIPDTKKALQRKPVEYMLSKKQWEASFREYVNLYQKIKKFQTTSTAIAATAEIRKTLFDKGIVLPLLDVIVTTKCSLKCKKCFHLIPYYAKEGRHPFDVDKEEIKNDLKKLLSSVDYIVKVNILGGEPFLYGKLDELLMELTAFEKVGYFMIISNTTVVPKDSTCEILRNPKFYVQYNNYGVSSTREEEILEKMERFQISYGIVSSKKWYDYGTLQKQFFSEEKLTENYQKCEFADCKALMQGELHTCAFHKHGQRNGLIEETGEFLRLSDYTQEELRKEIVEFYKKQFFKACDYCNIPGVNETLNIIPAGEQE